MERHAVAPLLEERRLVSTLPESIHASSLLVDGSFRINHETGELILWIRARQDGIIIQEFKVEGPLERLHTLCADVARRLVSLGDTKFAFKAMNPSLEAEMLVHEAAIYQRRGQLDRALPALDGAYALAPDSVEIQRLLLRNRIAKKLGHGLKQDPRVGVDWETLHWAFTMAERILQHPSVPVSGSARQDIEIFQAVSSFLSAVSISLSRKLSVDEPSSDFQETVSRYWELMALSRDVYAGISPANHRRLLYQSSQILYITPDVDESLRITDWILADYEAIDSEPIVISTLVDAVKTFHSENPAGLEKIETYLHDLRGADRVDTRLTALKGSIRFYAHVMQDYGPAREFAREYIDLAGRNQRINPRAISLHRFAEDDTANDVYRAEFLSEILRIAFDEDLLNLSTASRWVSCTLRLADHLENLNRPDEALEWVRRLMQVYDRHRSTQWQYLRDRAVALESRYFQEEAVPLPGPSRQKKPELMISHHDAVFADNGLHRIRFLRADHVNSFPVLLFSTGQEIGIVRFDGPDADSVSIQTHPRPLPNIDRRFIGAWERANDAVMAVHGNSVFVGLPNDGIVGFHPDGNIEVLNEDHGLAYNRIRHMAVLGDYLYAITGAVGEDSGILEIDLRTRQTRMLASSGSERRNPVLDGRRINGIAADPEHGVLWIYSSHNLLDNRYDPKIVRYTPRDQTYRIYEDEALTAFLRGSYSTDNAGSLGLFGNALLIRNGSGLYRLDLKDNSGEVLVKSFGRTTWDFPRRYSGHPVVLFEGGMASMVFDQLVLFKEGLRDPVFVPTEWFSHVGGRTPRIIRLFSSPGEILLLASNALYRIREPEKMY
ncbi:MAG: hypothetical protein JJU05_01280 [Verrucomicrobia bacterium]|nr:hypothetical protein [Verrucomicrobiota bacterium]MCH8525884.1 hypothetical protein [Kiritimatiellia bacterium]